MAKLLRYWIWNQKAQGSNQALDQQSSIIIETLYLITKWFNCVFISTQAYVIYILLPTADLIIL